MTFYTTYVNILAVMHKREQPHNPESHASPQAFGEFIGHTRTMMQEGAKTFHHGLVLGDGTRMQPAKVKIAEGAETPYVKQIRDGEQGVFYGDRDDFGVMASRRDRPDGAYSISQVVINKMSPSIRTGQIDHVGEPHFVASFQTEVQHAHDDVPEVSILTLFSDGSIDHVGNWNDFTDHEPPDANHVGSLWASQSQIDEVLRSAAASGSQALEEMLDGSPLKHADTQGRIAVGSVMRDTAEGNEELDEYENARAELLHSFDRLMKKVGGAFDGGVIERDQRSDIDIDQGTLLLDGSTGDNWRIQDIAGQDLPAGHDERIAYYAQDVENDVEMFAIQTSLDDGGHQNLQVMYRAGLAERAMLGETDDGEIVIARIEIEVVGDSAYQRSEVLGNGMVRHTIMREAEKEHGGENRALLLGHSSEVEMVTRALLRLDEELS